jgi:hypothetical protein
MGRVEWADKHRHQAEELRARAEMVYDDEIRIGYLRMAEVYEKMADSEEQEAGSIGKTK